MMLVNSHGPLPTPVPILQPWSGNSICLHIDRMRLSNQHAFSGAWRLWKEWTERNQLILFRGIRENITQFNVFKHKLFALTRGPGETGESLAGWVRSRKTERFHPRAWWRSRGKTGAPSTFKHVICLVPTKHTYFIPKYLIASSWQSFPFTAGEKEAHSRPGTCPGLQRALGKGGRKPQARWSPRRPSPNLHLSCPVLGLGFALSFGGRQSSPEAVGWTRWPLKHLLHVPRIPSGCLVTGPGGPQFLHRCMSCDPQSVGLRQPRRPGR